MPLGPLTPEAFLRDYWQQKPLLIRDAFPDFKPPLSPEELAALSCQEEVGARLILEQGGDYPWELRYGPFEPEDFDALPDTHWTLLVQEVDRHHDGVAALLEAFRFIPNWRIDDVMASYAPAHGGVGAHVDNYDVFLVQGLGHRRWQIHHTPVQEERLVPDLDVSMLADFVPDAEWVLAPGDLLYLPPRIPHHGVALDDCMTFSIGFRAPSHLDLVNGFLGHLFETLDPDVRYSDPGLAVPDHPGEIAPDVLQHIRSFLRSTVADDAVLDDWFGRFVTERRREPYPEPPAQAYRPARLRKALGEGARLRCSGVSDFAFIANPDGTATLFASGNAYPLSASLAYAAPLLTGTSPLNGDTLAPHLADGAFVELLVRLVNEGVLGVRRGG